MSAKFTNIGSLGHIHRLIICSIKWLHAVRTSLNSSSYKEQTGAMTNCMLYCTISAYLCPEKRPGQDSMCLFDQQTHLLNTVCATHKLRHTGGLSSHSVVLKNEHGWAGTLKDWALAVLDSANQHVILNHWYRSFIWRVFIDDVCLPQIFIPLL